MAEQNSYDFWTRYSNLCLKCKVCPLKSVIKHMRGTTLCCPVERIRSEHWQFLLSALSIDNSLTEVCFKSDLPSLDEQRELWKKRRRRNNESYPIPYGYSPHNISDICKYSARLLTVSQTLQALIIENLPITKEDAEHLAEGLKSTYIKEFAFRCYPHSNDVIETVCRGLWDSKVSLLDFSACNLSIVGLKFICNVIKKHKDRRTIDAFPETLRYRLPIFEEMMGLTRVILNGNNIGDKGVEIICDTICDDRWIQALDLQCCGITSEGAMALLNQITDNSLLQVVDLRLNDIDEAIMERISMQLGVNSFGKIVNYTLLPLWKPRLFSKTIPARKNKLKTKVMKKYTRTRVVRKEVKSLEHAFRISCEIFDSKDTNTEDAAVQTVANSEVMNLQERVRRLELRLLKEMSMRDSLMDLMEKFKLENANLRQEVIKLSTFEDVILIDQETYSEIKHVFEKFQRFLRLMKDYGLWGLVSTIGVAEYENTKLKAVPSDSKVCMVEKEHLPSESRPTNGPVKGPPVPKPQVRCCSCRKPECISNQKAEKENQGSNMNHNQKGTQDKSQLKNIVDKAKVTKVFKELRETYTNCDFAKQLPAVPPLARKLSSGELSAAIKPANKPLPFKSNVDIPNKFKQIKTRQDLYEAVKSEMERIECVCQLHKIPQSPEKFQGNPVPIRNQNSVNNKSYFKNVSSQTATVDSIVNYKCQKVNPVALSGSSSSIVSQKSGHNSGSSSSTMKSFPSEGYPSGALQQAVNLVSREWDEHVKKNFPECNVEQQRPAAGADVPPRPIIVDPEYFKAWASSKKQGSEQSSKVSERNQMPKQEVNSVSNKIVKTPVSSASSEVNSASVNSIESHASEQEIKSKSSQTSTSKDNSGKSYLESVSDASTDKDVKSLSEMEIYDSDYKNDSVTSKNSNKSSKGQKAGGSSGGSNNALGDNSSKSSKKSQKQKKLSNQNSTGGGKPQKENVSSSSVPSLSDITTVSSHSLNTDSVMDQLSENEKGLS